MRRVVVARAVTGRAGGHVSLTAGARGPRVGTNARRPLVPLHPAAGETLSGTGPSRHASRTTVIGTDKEIQSPDLSAWFPFQRPPYSLTIERSSKALRRSCSPFANLNGLGLEFPKAGAAFNLQPTEIFAPARKSIRKSQPKVGRNGVPNHWGFRNVITYTLDS